jgi:DNA polymerase III subunit epsilon
MRLRRPQAGAAAEFAGTRRPARGTPWREARWCALDLELTGLDPRSNDIIAIGAVPIEDGRVVLGGAAYTLVRTDRRSEHGAVLVHKLRLADVADAPSLDEAMELLLELLAGSIPVFHTARVERGFLSPLFSARRLRMPDAADTEVLGRAWLRGRDGEAPSWLSLALLARLLRLPEEPPHHALGDALTTAKSFIALASHLDAVEPQTVGSLLDAGSRAGGWRRFGPG